MLDKININMGSFMVAPGSALLEARGIGSGVVICLYSKGMEIGGMARIMAPKGSKKVSQIRFVDSALDHLIEGVSLLGCGKKNLKAKVFGGASLFEELDHDLAKANIEAVEEKLRKAKIKIESEDIGGNKGRSIYFNTKDGSVMVKFADGTSKRK